MKAIRTISRVRSPCLQISFPIRMGQISFHFGSFLTTFLANECVHVRASVGGENESFSPLIARISFIFFRRREGKKVRLRQLSQCWLDPPPKAMTTLIARAARGGGGEAGQKVRRKLKISLFRYHTTLLTPLRPPSTWSSLAASPSSPSFLNAAREMCGFSSATRHAFWSAPLCSFEHHLLSRRRASHQGKCPLFRHFIFSLSLHPHSHTRGPRSRTRLHRLMVPPL